MSADVRDYIEQRAHLIEWALQAELPAATHEGSASLNEAIHYAVFPGGKRLRPIMVLLAAEICGARPETALPVACAIEFLHAASLIFDDLPAMDDAETRRGRKTVHAVFGEGIALLAALALLNQSYAIFGRLPALFPTAIREIGVGGMIGGQAIDLHGTFERSRVEKTTALTRLAMAAGAASAGAKARDTEELIAFGDMLGEAYQICDDIMDALATDIQCGKTTGQDQRHNRGSLMTQLGQRGACERVRTLVEGGNARLRGWFGSPRSFLMEEFARTIVASGVSMAAPDYANADLVKHDPAFALVGLHSSGRVDRDSLAGGATPYGINGHIGFRAHPSP